jgi:hypothetical protein
MSKRWIVNAIQPSVALISLETRVVSKNRTDIKSLSCTSQTLDPAVVLPILVSNTLLVDKYG